MKANIATCFKKITDRNGGFFTVSNPEFKTPTPQEMVFKRLDKKIFHIDVNYCETHYPCVDKLLLSELTATLNLSPSLYIEVNHEDLHYIWKIQREIGNTDGAKQVCLALSLVNSQSNPTIFLSIDFFVEPVAV